MDTEGISFSQLEYDELTGVYTRQAFFYYADRVLKEHPEKQYSLIISDICNFKMVNERYGEEYANQVLTHGASTLVPMLRAGIPVGRYSGDKFILLMEYVPENIDEQWLISELNHIKETFPVTGLELKLGIYNNVDRKLPIRLLCDRALLAVRSIGHQYDKTIAYYDDALQKQLERRNQLESCMKQAYYEDQFQVYYQPKHDAVTGKLIGAEALIRWKHPQLGLLTPDQFIPLFERNGFIVYADYYAWKRTCQNLRRWIDDGIHVVPVSVNTSRRDYEYPDYVGMILKPLRELKVDPSLMHIEVTESLFTNRLEELGELIQNCRDAGFRIELDDFGSGYSSLGVLGTIPVDIMKIDRSLVIQLQNLKKVRVLSACIMLARSLGLRTIAEGVETEEQLKQLRSLGCDAIQGYYYAKPMTEEQFADYMRQCMKKETEEPPAEQQEGSGQNAEFGA